MGKGGRGKSSAAATTASKANDDDDDKLLAAAIAENHLLAKQQEAAQLAAQELGATAKGATWWGGEGEPPKSAMAADQIVAKLNSVPSFCLLNGESVLLGLKDLTDATGKRKICAWFTDPNEAKAMLTQCKAHSPDIADGLHLGVTPLGVAYAFACGWAELKFDGDKQVHGSAEAQSGGNSMAESLRQQAIAQGLETKTWHVPVFTCAELASPSRMPFFLSQKALAESWLVSGRKLSDLGTNVAVCDLGVVVHQMQTGEFDGSKVQFVCERKAIALVEESKQVSAAKSAAAPAPDPSPADEEEPDHEGAVAAIQQALLAAALKDQAKSGQGRAGSDAESSQAPSKDEDEPGREEAVAAIQQALLAAALGGKTTAHSDAPPEVQ